MREAVLSAGYVRPGWMSVNLVFDSGGTRRLRFPVLKGMTIKKVDTFLDGFALVKANVPTEYSLRDVVETYRGYGLVDAWVDTPFGIWSTFLRGRVKGLEALEALIMDTWQECN